MTGGHAPIVRLGIRAASPFATIVGCYLLFAGHNNPGGGFAAGLVFGAVIALWAIAGLVRPAHGITVIAAGVFVVAGLALMPLLWGDPLLDQQVVTLQVPPLGRIKTGSALLFDIGVAAIVVGTVIAVLDGLGAAEFAADQQERAEADQPAAADHREQE